MYDGGQDVWALIVTGGPMVWLAAGVILLANILLVGIGLYSWMAALFGKHQAPDPF